MTDRTNTCWWLVDRSKAAQEVSRMAETLLSAYGRNLRRRMHAYRAVYLNEEHADYAKMGYHFDRGSKYPVTQGGVDSLHAKLALSRPRPKIVPGSRRFKVKRRAKNLQRWVDGLWRKNDTEKLQDDQLHDAEIYGAGVIKVLERHGHVAHERRHPGDILTDPREERRSAVRSLFEVANMDREMLSESEFVEGSDMRKKVLEVSAPPEQEDVSWTDDGPALDQVKVLEAWRLPPCPDRSGRHVIAVGDLVLLDEGWEWDCFPFSVLVWGRDPERTFQGQGIVERGLRVQAMLNHHCQVIDESFERFVPKYAVQRNSGVDPTVIDRSVGQVVEYDIAGGAPSVLSPGPISPDFLGYAAELANRWFAVTGVSQMDARSEADPSLESGKAKLVQGDINSGRFYTQGKARERACTRLAELSIKMADAICDHYEMDERESDEERTERQSMTIDTYATDPSQRALAPANDVDEEEPETPKLEVPGGRGSWRETMPYEHARMKGKGEAFAVEVFPVSSLSQSIHGRMEEVSQLTAGGYITNPDTARELLDLPILAEYQDLASARREAAEREIDMCLDGEQGIPSAYLDLQHALERATQEYCLAGIDGAAEEAPEVMDALRNFIGATEALMKKIGLLPPDAPPPDDMAQPTEPPMVPGEPPMPMGPPVAAVA